VYYINTSMYPYRRKRRGLRIAVTLTLTLLLFVGAGTANYLRPLPLAVAAPIPLTSEINTVHLSWPTNSQVALGATGYGTLARHGPQSPLPIASLAKVITALAILQQKPLHKGQQGPAITLSDADVSIYNQYLARQGAVVKVTSGEQISEYQALQAMLLASANNVADSTAIWAFGSLEKYTAYANTMVRQERLTNTTISDDASGFSPKTTSTSEDLVHLGEQALQNPVISEIIAQSEATLPVAGKVKNNATALAQEGLLSIKTGSSDQAHACLLYAATTTIGGQTITLVGATLNAHDLRAAVAGAKQLMDSAKPNFIVETPVTAGQSFGIITTAWGAQATIAAATNVTMIVWKGAPLTPQLQLRPMSGGQAQGAEVGSIVVNSKENHGSTSLTLQQPLPGPSFRWRLLRL